MGSPADRVASSWVSEPLLCVLKRDLAHRLKSSPTLHAFYLVEVGQVAAVAQRLDGAIVVEVAG